MGLAERLSLYGQLEKARGGRPLIVYVTSTRPGLESKMLSDAIPEFLDQLVKLPKDAENVDLLVVSRGGDPMMACATMTLLHARVKHVAVLVPQVAYSAATMLAMGANEIVMHPHGNLGPVDPQIEVTHAGEAGQPGQRQRFGFEDLAGFLEFAKKEVGLTDQEHVRHMFEMFCKQVGPVPVAVAARAALLTVTMGEKLLRLHMGEDVQKARSIAETLNKSFFDHGYPVSRREAKEDIKLPIAEENEEVEDLMWRIWLDVEEELKARKPFNPLHEALSSVEGSKLLGPVHQSTAPPTGHLLQQIVQNFNLPPAQGTQRPVMPDAGDFLGQLFRSSVVNIQPVEFELLTAIMESTRTASHERAKGKILACRMPDLTFRLPLQLPTLGGSESRLSRQPQRMHNLEDLNMFPNFRIVSDGPLSGTETFISNESFYATQPNATESPLAQIPSGAAQQPNLMGQDILLPEYMATEQPTDEDVADAQ